MNTLFELKVLFTGPNTSSASLKKTFNYFLSKQMLDRNGKNEFIALVNC